MLGCVGAAVDIGRMQVHQFTRESTWDVLMVSGEYLLYLPDGYEDQPQRDWPMIVYLHGVGEHGHDLNRLARTGLPRLLEDGLEIPFIVIAPQNTGELKRLWWTDLLAALVEDVTRNYRVDRSRIYLTGTSLGGYTAWTLAWLDDRYAAIVPLSAWGYPDEVTQAADVPVWAFHGDGDFIVPAHRHEKLVEAHREAGGESRWSVISGGHDITRQVYTQQELYDWLLQQRR